MDPEDQSHRNMPRGSGLREAETALVEVDRVAALLSKDVHAMRVALLTWAGFNVFGLLLIGLLPSLVTGVAGTVAIVGSSVPVMVVGARARARDRDFARRYLITIGIWSVLFAATIQIGMNFLLEVPAFWVPASLLCAVPAITLVVTGTRRVG